ncbi:unnamed protein product, partial [marine sediment metagenome]
EAGLSLFEADGSMRAIADIIQDMEGYLGAMTVKQREAALAQLGFNLRTKDSMLTLMGSSEKIRKWTEDLKNMGGITEEVYKKQLMALTNQFLSESPVLSVAFGGRYHGVHFRILFFLIVIYKFVYNDSR